MTLIIGAVCLFVGAGIGFFVAALVHAASDADSFMDNIRKGSNENADH
mgnify:FL=1